MDEKEYRREYVKAIKNGDIGTAGPMTQKILSIEDWGYMIYMAVDAAIEARNAIMLEYIIPQMQTITPFAHSTAWAEADRKEWDVWTRIRADYDIKQNKPKDEWNSPPDLLTPTEPRWTSPVLTMKEIFGLQTKGDKAEFICENGSMLADISLSLAKASGLQISAHTNTRILQTDGTVHVRWYKSGMEALVVPIRIYQYDERLLFLKSHTTDDLFVNINETCYVLDGILKLYDSDDLILARTYRNGQKHGIAVEWDHDKIITDTRYFLHNHLIWNLR